jgi:predicted NAD/FAD-binding protein
VWNIQTVNLCFVSVWMLNLWLNLYKVNSQTSSDLLRFCLRKRWLMMTDFAESIISGCALHLLALRLASSRRAFWCKLESVLRLTRPNRYCDESARRSLDYIMRWLSTMYGNGSNLAYFRPMECLMGSVRSSVLKNWFPNPTQMICNICESLFLSILYKRNVLLIEKFNKNLYLCRQSKTNQK